MKFNRKNYDFLFLILIGLLPFSRIYAQTIEPIIASCTNYSGNIAYNSGEVFVIFNINSNPIVSRNLNRVENDLEEEQDTERITFYPNPVKDVLSFRTPKNKIVTWIKIYTMDGRIVLDKEVQNNRVDVTNLLMGSYILKTNFTVSTIFKLIKI